MLDGDDRVPGTEEPVEEAEQEVRVRGMKPRRGLVEKVEGRAAGRVHQLGGELETLPFASRQGIEGLAEAEIVEADLGQEPQPGRRLGQAGQDLRALADVSGPCEVCGGSRYNSRVLEVRVSGRTIADILGLTAAEGAQALSGLPKAAAGLRLLSEIGLDYLGLGQSLDTLSGGERQRLKLAAELMDPPRGPALYLFDEPTTGLHPSDADRLFGLFDRLLRAGHTIVAVEHDLDLISRAGHIVDLGPEGGDEGGRLVVQGTPEDVCACPASQTGAALREYLARRSSQRP